MNVSRNALQRIGAWCAFRFNELSNQVTPRGWHPRLAFPAAKYSVSMKRLLDYRFEWVLPGHGQRVQLPAAEIR